MSSPSESKQYVAPTLRGRHVYLRAVMPEDYAFLRQIETSSPMAHRWRLRGAAPGPEAWIHGLTQGQLALWVVATPKERRVLGMISVYNASFQDGYAWLAAAHMDGLEPSPTIILALALAIDYVFTCWNFRKLYMEVAEYNYSQFASSATRWCELEGRWRDHWYFHGQFWDLLTLALYRERWDALAPKLLAAERPPAPTNVRVRMSRPPTHS